VPGSSHSIAIVEAIDEMLPDAPDGPSDESYP